MEEENLLERAKSLGMNDVSISEVGGVKVFSYTLNRRGKIIKGSSTINPFKKFLERLEIERNIRKLEAERRKYYQKWPETRKKVEEIDNEVQKLKTDLKNFIGG